MLPDRRGYGGSPTSGPADFDVDAGDVASLLGEGAHLVGHSYGAVVALLVAARRPAAVRTLTVVEPAALALARDDEAVQELTATLRDVYAAAAGLDPAEFVLRFLEALGYRRGADMLRGWLLTGAAPRLFTNPIAGGAGPGVVSEQRARTPLTKVSGRYLAPWLTAHGQLPSSMKPPTIAP